MGVIGIIVIGILGTALVVVGILVKSGKEETVLKRSAT